MIALSDWPELPHEVDRLARPVRIDCQSHIFCEEIVQLMEQRTDDPRIFRRNGERILQMGGWLRKVPPAYLDIKVKLAAMDASGVEIGVLSINDPGPEWFGADGPRVAKIMNDFIARLVREYPTRFIGLCVLPFQDVSEALSELERCVRQLGMKGILLYTNLAGRHPDDPAFRPVFARAEQLGLPMLLHPAKPLITDLVKEFEMTSSLGNMFENTLALNRMIMAGMLDEFPRLQLVCPHLGGLLPYMVGRIDHQVSVLKRGPKHLTKLPSEYLKQVWFDIVSPMPLAMEFAWKFTGPDRLLFASDHPWVEPALILDCLRQAGLPREDEEKILSGNARKLFRL